MTLSLGIDLGGTKALACLLDGHGAILARALRPTGRATRPAAALAIVRALASDILHDAGRGFDCVGVGFPGLVDFEEGVARSSVILDGWRDVPFAEMVGAALGAPCVLDNDVNAALVAELHARAGGAATMSGATLFVAAGTGIGGAVAMNGALFRGACGAAGEIGHTSVPGSALACWCGRRGCVGAVASGSAIERSLGLAAGSLAEHFPSPRVAAALRRSASALGEAITGAVNLLDPGLVVIGGGLARIEGFVEEVARHVRAGALSRGERGIEAARAGYEAGAVGAALLGSGR